MSHTPPLTFADRALLLDETLVVADLHIGRDALSPVELPLGERRDLTDRLAALLDQFSPATVVFAGDVLHSFSSVPDGVPRTLSRLSELVSDAGADLVVTPGNHDPMLSSLWDGPLDDEVRVGETVVCHGHALPETDAARYVVGHDHPTIEVEGRRYPCFLRGTYEGRELVMLPAFTRLAPGRLVNRLSASAFQSPLVTDADALRPVVHTGTDTHEFPPLGRFRHLL